jgi:MFS family permease
MTDQAAIQAEVDANFKWNFVVNAIDITFYMFASNMVSQSTIMPLLVSQLTTSKLVIGLVPSIFSLGFLLPQLLLVNYTERLRRKKPLIVLVSGLLERGPYLVIALVVMLLAKNSPNLALVLFFVMIAMTASAGGILMPAWSDMIAKVIPLKYRGVWWGTGNSLGALLGVAGAALAGYFLGTFPFPMNFALCFFVSSGAQFLSWVGLSLCREPETLDPKPSVSLWTYFRRLPDLLRRDHNYRAYLLSRSVMNMGYMASGFITVYAVETFHVSGAEVGGLTAVLVGTQAVMNMAWGLLADRRGNKLVLCLAAFGMAVTVLTVSATGGGAWLWIIYVLLGVALAADNIAGMNIVMEFGREEDRPTYIGLTNTLLAPTRSLAPILGGWLATLAGYTPMFFTAIAVCCVGGMMMVAWVREPRHYGLGSQERIQGQ